MPSLFRSSTSYPNQVSFSFLAWMVIFAVIASAGGVTYAVLKSKQVEVKTEIKRLSIATNASKLSADQYRAMTNDQTNRWVMLARLRDDHSTLRTIRPGQVEIARSQETLIATTAR